MGDTSTRRGELARRGEICPDLEDRYQEEVDLLVKEIIISLVENQVEIIISLVENQVEIIGFEMKMYVCDPLELLVQVPVGGVA